MMSRQTSVESTETLSYEQVIVNALKGRASGRISEAIAEFAEEFQFKDHGIGLDFHDKKTLAEFFRKTQECFPDSSIHVDASFVDGDHVIGKWTLHTSLAEPFYGGLTRKVPISLHGVSILRIANGRITDWADYYDGLTSRRTALASHFTEWIDL